MATADHTTTGPNVITQPGLIADPDGTTAERAKPTPSVRRDQAAAVAHDQAAEHGAASPPDHSPIPEGPPDQASLVAREVRRHRWLGRRDLALAALTPLVLLLAWQVLATTGTIDDKLFPPPTRIASEAANLLRSGALTHDTLVTLRRLLLGYVAGAVLGVLSGLLMGTWRSANAALSPTFAALYALPKIAILPLLLLIFGLGETPKVLSVAITIFFVLQINTLAGVRQIDPRTLEAARSYGATGLKRFRYVIVPACTPAIFTGLKVATGLGVVVIIAVEFVASNDGLGFMIWNAWTLFQPDRMYVGLVVVAVLGAALTGLVTVIERASLPWQRASRPRRRHAVRRTERTSA